MNKSSNRRNFLWCATAFAAGTTAGCLVPKWIKPGKEPDTASAVTVAEREPTSAFSLTELCRRGQEAGGRLSRGGLTELGGLTSIVGFQTH